MTRRLRTPEEVKADFARKGISLSAWARQNGIHPKQVHDVLSGRTRGKYGDAHKIAVLLGIKDGEIIEGTA